MRHKQMENVGETASRIILQALTVVAYGNANKMCRALLYEPKVPQKLQKKK